MNLPLNLWGMLAMDGGSLEFKDGVVIPCEERERCVRMLAHSAVKPCAVKDGHAWRSFALWARCKSKESVGLLGAWPLRPTFVVKDGPVRRTALWALEEPVSAQECADANKRLAYALRAPQVYGNPDEFLLPLGLCEEFNHSLYSAGEVVLGLSEPPARSFA